MWVWTHILQFNLANQIKAPEEDKINKPSRPLPAGRISLRNATLLRWLIAPLCLAYSSLYSTQLMFASLEMQLFTLWYNEFDGDKNWLSKNVVLAIMYGCMELGGTLSAGTFIVHRSPCPIAHPAHHVFLLCRHANPTKKTAIPPKSAKLGNSRFNSPSPSSPLPCTAKTLKTLKVIVSPVVAPSRSCSPSLPALSLDWAFLYGPTSSAASGTSTGSVPSRSLHMDVSSEGGSCACGHATQINGPASITA